MMGIRKVRLDEIKNPLFDGNEALVQAYILRRDVISLNLVNEVIDGVYQLEAFRRLGHTEALCLIPESGPAFQLFPWQRKIIDKAYQIEKNRNFLEAYGMAGRRCGDCGCIIGRQLIGCHCSCHLRSQK